MDKIDPSQLEHLKMFPDALREFIEANIDEFVNKPDTPIAKPKVSNYKKKSRRKRR